MIEINVAQALRTTSPNGRPDMRHLTISFDPREIIACADSIKPAPVSCVLEWLLIAGNDPLPRKRVEQWIAFSGIQPPTVHVTLGKDELSGVFYCNRQGVSFAFAIDPFELEIAADEFHGTDVAAALLHLGRLGLCTNDYRRFRRWEEFRDHYVTRGELIGDVA